MTGKPIDVERLTQRKVTVPALMLVGILVLGWRADGITVDYLDDFFILKAEAEEQIAGISKQVHDNSELIVAHIGEYKLNENASRIARAESQLYDLEFHVETNGASELTRDRERALKAEVAKLKRVRSCIVRNQHKSEGETVENCDAII